MSRHAERVLRTATSTNSRLKGSGVPSTSRSDCGALSSALAGMGRTVLPVPLVEDALERGTLTALDEKTPSRRAYWLVAPVPQWRSKKVKALVEFLTS